MNRKIRMAIAGLGFGAEFIPIYQNHPHTEMYAICQRSSDKLKTMGDHFGIPVRYASFEEMLKDVKIDAVHINTPIPNHAEQSIAALNAGKHVACTVPMATSVEDCRRIVEAQHASGKNYMMMETAVYTREFLHVKKLRDSGALGRIQFLRGAHQQEMAGWPGYWEGLPPMHYATHAVSPLLALAESEVDFVSCFGSGRIADCLIEKYGSPFAVESALFRLKNSTLAAEVTRSLFETSREYIESFDIYADTMSFEWQRLEDEDPALFTGEDGKRVKIPDYAHLLPESIRRYTTEGVYDSQENQHLSFTQGSGHGGSHPHLANEFVMSIVEHREPYPNVLTSANWTCAGICAHESAMKGGEIVKIPQF
ncbi:Gfo/Idh/MocA family protein [Paenibacillus allorhizosphaerae]|uniref:Inositol 2-dehydrogenase/D-chiro-inositol 3-dehydrogenase n=1 Tax=Paenibacillus allorhizosphaerae TaxID=2849866 RepID=A0ABN7TVW8_9BACL|nr:Gfo/Idh/MocA family oxidoreductase [Paenibacillus allorhizosphaerae]CAG7654366.1 Inositol 2-dehydrogenase/D-chiro-inositol 3-dehydrogenase [Paenibacillus allorhizosphaerae]